MKNHLKKWWHVHALVLVIAAIAIAFIAGAFTGAASSYFGVKLGPKGVQIYKHIESHGGIEQGGHVGEVQLTPSQLAKLRGSAADAASQLHPNVQATPEPKMIVQPIVRNFYPGRSMASKYLILVPHDTESPSAPGIADLEAVRAWFSNPNAQASANYVDDPQGNVLEMVDPRTGTAWHVAQFNQWAIGVEEIGYASQTHWPLLQIEATAKIFAHWATVYGIPIQRGKVSGCTIVRPGIVPHGDLGLCGGGHHDPGDHYPIGLLIRLTRLYAHEPHRPRHHHHHHHGHKPNGCHARKPKA
jgi:N-acetyl-anhydromuramyl-L-alanine amidase AmpD